MPTKPLTDTALRATKPKDKPYKVSDGGGLHVVVDPSGARLWRLAYRFDGKQKTLALGRYPDVSLLRARKGREAAKDQLRAGIDPSAERRQRKAAAAKVAIDTFELVGKAWLGNTRESWSKVHYERQVRRLEKDLFPELGAKHVGEIDAPALLAVLRKVEDRGAIAEAKRLKQTAGQIFRYAIAQGLARRDPSGDLKEAMKAAPRVKHRAALKAAELPAFLTRLAAYDGEALTRLGLRLILLTMVRTNEARFARWPEFEGLTGDAPTWRIPATRMKSHLEHLVPLAPQAVRVLEQLRPLAGGSDWVFPANTKTGTLSENTFLFALYRMGYHSKATVHGFRGTASTILNEHGFASDHVERQLSHVEENEVRAAYNSAEWLPQRREMLKWWADYLDRQALSDIIG